MHGRRRPPAAGRAKEWFFEQRHSHTFETANLNAARGIID
jgi:hypothetical protein